MKRVSGIISKREKARYSDHTILTVVRGYRNKPATMRKVQYMNEFGISNGTLKIWCDLVDNGEI